MICSSPVTSSGTDRVGQQSAFGLRGPACLGRSVIVWSGQPAPEGWEGCRRVLLEMSAGPQMRSAWAEREPLVVEIAEGDDLPDDGWSRKRRWWELDPKFNVGEESLRFLAVSNSVDARDPDNPRFAPLEQAMRLGARLPPPGGPGDAVSPSGQRIWCDGGPLAPFAAEDLLAGQNQDDWGPVRVVPAANLAVGSLAPIFPAEPKAELAADQLAAVAHVGGGARIVAPAGSGKTRVLTERARHLVKGLGVDAGAVCLVAYNKRAQEEMQERLADVEGVQVRTLNSLGLAICNGTGPFARPRGFARVETVDEPAVREIVDRLAPLAPRKAMVDRIGPYIEALAASRLGLRDPASVEAAYHPDADGFAAVADAYAAQLDEKDIVDFDHQIIRAIEVLLADPQARRAARRACSVMLVDEFQDLTPAHLLLVRLLAGPRADVFAVGDDDQTIYGYSGASPAWLIDYDQYFPRAARHDLNVNYRCPPEVVDAAASLLSYNADRLEKQTTARPGREQRPPNSPDGPAVRAKTAQDPALLLKPHIGRLLDSGAQPGEIAVLCRVNSALLAPQLVLADMGIPSDRPVGPPFLTRTGAEAALAWVEAATATDGIGPKTMGIIARRPPAVHPQQRRPTGRPAAHPRGADRARRPPRRPQRIPQDPETRRRHRNPPKTRRQARNHDSPAARIRPRRHRPRRRARQPARRQPPHSGALGPQRRPARPHIGRRAPPGPRRVRRLARTLPRRTGRGDTGRGAAGHRPQGQRARMAPRDRLRRHRRAHAPQPRRRTRRGKKGVPRGDHPLLGICNRHLRRRPLPVPKRDARPRPQNPNPGPRQTSRPRPQELNLPQ